MQRSFGRPELGEQYLNSKEKAEERTRQNRAGEPPPAEMSGLTDDALDAPQPYFGPNAFSIDPSRRLWVITNRAQGDSTEVDVFRSEGMFLQTIALRDRVTALAFRGTPAAALVARTAATVEGVQGIDTYELK